MILDTMTANELSKALSELVNCNDLMMFESITEDFEYYNKMIDLRGNEK